MPLGVCVWLSLHLCMGNHERFSGAVLGDCQIVIVQASIFREHCFVL